MLQNIGKCGREIYRKLKHEIISIFGCWKYGGINKWWISNRRQSLSRVPHPNRYIDTFLCAVFSKTCRLHPNSLLSDIIVWRLVKRWAWEQRRRTKASTIHGAWENVSQKVHWVNLPAKAAQRLAELPQRHGSAMSCDVDLYHARVQCLSQR